MPASGRRFVSIDTNAIPIPASSAIEITMGDANVFCPDSGPADLKLQVETLDFTANLLDDVLNPFAVNLLGTLQAAPRPLSANGGTVEGVSVPVSRPFLIPSLVGGNAVNNINTGEITRLQFSANSDIHNIDAGAAHNAQIALEVIWRFVQG